MSGLDFGRPGTYAGLRIVWSDLALEDSSERLFPASRHRSKRIHKKLVKRFGGEFRRVPAMWRYGNMIVAHPSFRAQLAEAAANPSPRKEGG